MSFFARIRRTPDPADVAEPVTSTQPATSTEPAPAGTPRRWRRIAAVVTTVVAALLVFAALVAPNRLSRLTPGGFARLPVEALAGVAVLVLLPPRVRRVVAALAGVLLGLLTILKMLDMGFIETLDRTFDPVLDWPLLGDGLNFVQRTYGVPGAVVAVAVAVVVAGSLVALLTGSVLRLTRVAARHRTASLRTAAVLGVAWIALAATGVTLVPLLPLAANSTAALAYDRAGQIRVGLQDKRAFAAEAAVDAYRDTPGDQFLTALRGKDVLVTFVESYGRVAVADPEFAPRITALLAAGTRDLAAAGFGARSAFLTSPTAGGGSWLAHSTLLSGLWIDNQQRYHNLLASDRLTLDGAFKRAGWRTVGVQPAVTRAWPEASFYGYDRLLTAQNLGYRGPLFNFASMPDQYTLSAFQHDERSVPGHAPIMAEMALLSSHSPWAPLPRLVDWNAVGDGTVFDGMPETGEAPNVDRTRVRDAYRQAVEYSLNTLISYVLTYGGDNLVLVFLGDHQPAPIVSGEGAPREVPVTIVAHDPAVLARVAGWGWQDGLAPAPTSPVWRMDTFRDRFLSAFGPPAGPAPAAPVPPSPVPSPSTH